METPSTISYNSFCTAQEIFVCVIVVQSELTNRQYNLIKLNKLFGLLSTFSIKLVFPYKLTTIHVYFSYPTICINTTDLAKLTHYYLKFSYFQSIGVQKLQQDLIIYGPSMLEYRCQPIPSNSSAKVKSHLSAVYVRNTFQLHIQIASSPIPIFFILLFQLCPLSSHASS